MSYDYYHAPFVTSAGGSWAGSLPSLSSLRVWSTSSKLLSSRVILSANSCRYDISVKIRSALRSHSKDLTYSYRSMYREQESQQTTESLPGLEGLPVSLADTLQRMSSCLIASRAQEVWSPISARFMGAVDVSPAYSRSFGPLSGYWPIDVLDR